MWLCLLSYSRNKTPQLRKPALLSILYVTLPNSYTLQRGNWCAGTSPIGQFVKDKYLPTRNLHSALSKTQVSSNSPSSLAITPPIRRYNTNTLLQAYQISDTANMYMKVMPSEVTLSFELCIDKVELPVHNVVFQRAYVLVLDISSSQCESYSCTAFRLRECPIVSSPRSRHRPATSSKANKLKLQNLPWRRLLAD